MGRNRILLLPLLMLLTACNTIPGSSCTVGQQAAIQDFFYFGTATPDGAVSSEEWEGYLDASFAQGFPDGFTVWPAQGLWRTAEGAVVEEASYVLSLVHPESVEAETAIREFMAQYKTQFQQEAVLRVTSRVCMAL